MRKNPRRLAAVGTLVGALGATLGLAGFSPHRSLPTPRLPGVAEIASAARPAEIEEDEPTVHAVSVTASRYRFDPPQIEVLQGDVVKVDLRTADIAHSMTIDAYRIAKRVTPAGPVTFEFRANQAGTFPYYCNLQIDNGCREMRGQLVVKPRK
jgi:heme/copper-type cytochrome/quinol oxidase subunit 2